MITVLNDQADQLSVTIGATLIDLREAAKLSREDLAAAARKAGAPASMTAAVVRNIETGRPDAAGRRRRDVTVEELVWLAAALAVSPLRLLGAHAQAVAPDVPPPPAPPEECERCSGGGWGGNVLAAVREDVELLGDLVGVEPSLAEMAYALAAAVDEGGGEDRKQLAAQTKELRATLQQLQQSAAARMVEPDDDDDLGPE